MIDLHCHILPGIDDGAPNLEVSLAMAREAVADGIRITACTPHIYPGLYENTYAGIEAAIARLRKALLDAGIPLRLVGGADTHLVPGLLERLRCKDIPTLADSSYLLLEPAHHVIPPRFEESVFSLIAGGYIPVITHPERLSWINDHYEVFKRLVARGAWIQLTSGSLTGRFGSEARYWSERMLDEGLAHLLATDSHGVGKRPPRLAEGRRAAEKWVGAAEASRLVFERPACIINHGLPASITLPGSEPRNRSGWWSRLFSRKSADA